MTERPSPSHRATINDVARAAGVSRQTVSNVVNRPDRVADGTRERVEQVIARLGYRPSSAARSLRQQRAGAVGVELNTLGPGSASYVVHPFLVGLSLAARDHACHVVTFGSESDTPSLEGYEHMVRARLVDAFVLTDTHHGDPRPAYLTGEGIPWAAFGRVWDDPTCTTWADVDGRAGTRLAVEHLLDAGYRRVGYLGWPAGSATGDDRLAGWRDALDAAGHDAPLARTVQDLAAARDAAGPLLDAVGPGGAVAAVSDVVALGVLEAARARGLRPGVDVGVVGFDGSPLAAMHGITTVVQPLGEIAGHLLGLLQSALGGAPAPRSGRLVVPSLQVRASSVRTAAPTP